MMEARTILKIIADAHAPDARVQKEIQSLQAAGYRVNVVCWDREENPDLPAQKDEAHGRVFRYKRPSPRGRPIRFILTNFLFWAFAIRMARSLKPDVVHVHSIQVLPLGVLLRSLVGAPLVYDVHEITETFGRGISPHFGRWVWGVEQRFVLSVDLVLTVSDGLRDRYQGAVRPGVQVHTILNCLPLPELKKRPTRPRGAPFVIGRIGNLRPRSRIDLLADIVLGLVDRGYDIRFKYAGISLGSYGAVVAAEHQRMEEWATHRQWVPVEEFAAFYSDVDVLLNIHEPGDALEERFAYFSKVFEALALGVPVVINDFPSMTPMIEPSGAGLIVRPLTASAFIDCIASLIENPERLDDMRRSGRELAQERVNWSVMEQRLIDGYSSIT